MVVRGDRRPGIPSKYIELANNTGRPVDCTWVFHTPPASRVCISTVVVIHSRQSAITPSSASVRHESLGRGLTTTAAWQLLTDVASLNVVRCVEGAHCVLTHLSGRWLNGTAQRRAMQPLSMLQQLQPPLKDGLVVCYGCDDTAMLRGVRVEQLRLGAT
jgi:hypothetical protein